MPLVPDASPNYDSPPVAEVVLGVQFVPIERLQFGQFNAYAQLIAGDYPLIDEAPPLPRMIENVAGAPQELLLPNTPRIWFSATDGGSVLQLQRDRFLGNWRKNSDNTPYARYSNISREYFRRLSEFQEFLKRETGDTPQYTQFELSYINHIPAGCGWTSPDDLSRVFSFARPASRTFLPEPERIDYRSAFSLPRQSGRLHARIHNGQRRDNGTAVILFELTARGFAADINDWFATAHTWIVEGFGDITTTSVQTELWGRRS